MEGAKSVKCQKLDLELIVFSEESDEVVAELNSAIDRLEETHTIFGCGIDTFPIEHAGARAPRGKAHSPQRRSQIEPSRTRRNERFE